jgi:hypothetical protein
MRVPEAYIELKEEKVLHIYNDHLYKGSSDASSQIQASTFHDFLKFVYPQ